MKANTGEEKTEYSELELAEFKAHIERKIVEGMKQLEHYSEEIAKAESEQAKAKGLNDSIAMSAKFQSLALRQDKHLLHLNDALMRVKSGTYGLCQESGKLISKERLLAVPHAIMSVQAKKDKKSRRKRK